VLVRHLQLEGVAFGLNYGLGKVRFPAPLPVGKRVRMRMELQSVDDIPGGAQITMKLTFEQDGGGEARLRRRGAVAGLHRVGGAPPVCAAGPMRGPEGW
jgi:acyl dehydratase